MVVTVGENRDLFLLSVRRSVKVHSAEGFRVGNEAINDAANLRRNLRCVDFVNDNARTRGNRFPRF